MSVGRETKLFLKLKSAINRPVHTIETNPNETRDYLLAYNHIHLKVFPDFPTTELRNLKKKKNLSTNTRCVQNLITIKSQDESRKWRCTYDVIIAKIIIIRSWNGEKNNLSKICVQSWVFFRQNKISLFIHFFNFIMLVYFYSYDYSLFIILDVFTIWILIIVQIFVIDYST